MKIIAGFIKRLISYTIRIIATALIGTILLAIVYTLPSDKIEEKVSTSATVFAEEGFRPELFSWCSSMLDNYTDSIILLNSAYQNDDSAFVQAMQVPRNFVQGCEFPSDEIVAHYMNGEPFDGEYTYGRYWHGYLIFTKPLLYFTAYQNIRVYNAIIQISLIIYLFYLLIKNNLKQYIIPYMIAIAFLMPVTLAMCLQFSTCYYVLTIGSISLIKKREILSECEALIFLYIGIATAYFDLLTYPIATLGIPAVFYCCIRNRMSIAETFAKGIKLCFAWGFGYAGMWASKWILGSIITGQNLLEDASSQMSDRSIFYFLSQNSTLSNDISYMFSLVRECFFNTPATWFFICFAIISMLMVFAKICKQKISIVAIIETTLPFIILACLPVIWYIPTLQHTMWHYWFTCKALVVFVFSLLCGCVSLNKHTELK